MKRSGYIGLFLAGILISQPAFAFDINGDGHEGLEEAIHALQVVAGLTPDTTSEGNATEGEVLSGIVFSSDHGDGLVGVRPAAPPAKTGQTIIWHGGDDGTWQFGVSVGGARFADNGNGTFTDSLTGLTWLISSTCYGAVPWAIAVDNANSLGTGLCGLTDGSTAGDWRLPNIRELQTLVDYGKYFPAKAVGVPIVFGGIIYLWSSTSAAFISNSAWSLSIDVGEVLTMEKFELAYFTAVRNGISE